MSATVSPFLVFRSTFAPFVHQEFDQFIVAAKRDPMQCRVAFGVDGIHIS